MPAIDPLWISTISTSHGSLNLCRIRESLHRLSAHKISPKPTMGGPTQVSQLLRWVMYLHTGEATNSNMGTLRRAICSLWSSQWSPIGRWTHSSARCEQESLTKVKTTIQASCLTRRKLRDSSKALLASVDWLLQTKLISSLVVHKWWGKQLLSMASPILTRIKWISSLRLIGKTGEWRKRAKMREIHKTILIKAVIRNHPEIKTFTLFSDILSRTTSLIRRKWRVTSIEMLIWTSLTFTVRTLI